MLKFRKEILIYCTEQTQWNGNPRDMSASTCPDPTEDNWSEGNKRGFINYDKISN